MQTAEGLPPLEDHMEYGDLNFVAPERLLRVPEYMGPGWLECGRPRL
jgi:hypothetical protein